MVGLQKLFFSATNNKWLPAGAIDASEMLTAFHVLGIRTKRSEMEEMLAEVDADGSGEVEYAEFVQIMTTKMDARSQEQEPRNQPGKAQPLPFPLLAQAYRRKKLMEAVMGGDKSTQERLQARAEEMESERVAAIAEAEAQKRQIKKRPKALSEVTKERIRWKARLKKQEQDMPLEGYVLERIDQDVRDVIFGVHERAHIKRRTMSTEEKAALEEKIAEEKKLRDRERRASATKSSGTPLSKKSLTPETRESVKKSTTPEQKDNETPERLESAATSICTTPFTASHSTPDIHESGNETTTTHVPKSNTTTESHDSDSESDITLEPPNDTPEQQRAFNVSKLEGGQIASLDSQLQTYYKEDLKTMSSVRSKLRDKPTLEQQKIRLRALHSMSRYYQQEKEWENPVETRAKMNTRDSIHTPWRLPSHPIAPRKLRNVSHARIQYKPPVKPQKTRLTEKRPEWVNNIHLRRP
ncbi:hypothetical protein R1flu_006283 [Riccia fluitans]|uniref:EF-hand domain-containing protein n=1 Tax=Riccia fluitans TaxID=41844 RepID=A0ABD1YVK9_9MARC